MPEMGPGARDDALTRLASERFDLLVVGGGVTGAGIALDAASRGLSVALVERRDFASGTSSKSSKLIHGGLRYLAQYEWGLTWEALHERGLLRTLAPHLVRPLPFLYPVFRRREARMTPAGLTIYDAFAGSRGLMRGFGRHRRARDRVEELAPLLRRDGMRGAWLYYDGETDDARLVLEIVRTAHRFGAAVANDAEVVAIEHTAGRVCGALVADRAGGAEISVRARAVVNATGVWAGAVARLDDAASAPRLRPAKGVHVTIPAAALPLGAACIYPSPERDGRSLFAQPDGPVVVIGTTDTAYDGPVDAPAITPDDLAYVLDGTNRAFGLSLTAADVTGAWAGLRPLLDSKAEHTADLSRRHAVSVSPAGLVTITGGKMTTYRRMAADAVDLVCRDLGIRARCRTARIRLGVQGRYPALVAQMRGDAEALGLDPGLGERLAGAYGDRTPAVLTLAAEDPALAGPVAAGSPEILAQVAYAFRHEMARTLEDALARRVRLDYRDRDAGLGRLEAVAAAAGLSGEEARLQAGDYAARVSAERGPVPGPAPGSVDLRSMT